MVSLGANSQPSQSKCPNASHLFTTRRRQRLVQPRGAVSAPINESRSSCTLGVVAEKRFAKTYGQRTELFVVGEAAPQGNMDRKFLVVVLPWRSGDSGFGRKVWAKNVNGLPRIIRMTLVPGACGSMRKLPSKRWKTWDKFDEDDIFPQSELVLAYEGEKDVLQKPSIGVAAIALDESDDVLPLPGLTPAAVEVSASANAGHKIPTVGMSTLLPVASAAGGAAAIPSMDSGQPPGSLGLAPCSDEPFLDPASAARQDALLRRLARRGVPVADLASTNLSCLDVLANAGGASLSKGKLMADHSRSGTVSTPTSQPVSELTGSGAPSPPRCQPISDIAERGSSHILDRKSVASLAPGTPCDMRESNSMAAMAEPDS